MITLFSAIPRLGYVLLALPLSYYSGFALPHRFGSPTQSLGDWVLDRVKAGLIGGALALVGSSYYSTATRRCPNASLPLVRQQNPLLELLLLPGIIAPVPLGLDVRNNEKGKKQSLAQPR